MLHYTADKSDSRRSRIQNSVNLDPTCAKFTVYMNKKRRNKIEYVKAAPELKFAWRSEVGEKGKWGSWAFS